jgi:hypothetical protein
MCVPCEACMYVPWAICSTLFVTLYSPYLLFPTCFFLLWIELISRLKSFFTHAKISLRKSPFLSFSHSLQIDVSSPFSLAAFYNIELNP